MSSRVARAVARSYATLHNSSAGKRYASPLCDLCFSHPSAQQVCPFPCFPTLLPSPHASAFSNCNAQHGRSIHGMSQYQRFYFVAVVSSIINCPGPRNPRVPEKPIFRWGPHSSPFSIHLGSVDCQKTDSPDREAVRRHWRWVSHSTLDGNAGRRLGGVTGRAPPGDGTSQELRRVSLCTSPGRRDRKAYERRWRETRDSVFAVPSVQL